MNTEGHGKVAEEVGLPVLLTAYKAQGLDRVPLNAFHLGNWLTDLQQFVDPVAISAGGLKDSIRRLLDETFDRTYQRENGKDVTETPILNLSVVGRVMRGVEQRLDAAIDLWFLPLKQGDDRRTRLFDTLRSICRVAGYFLFVHPDIVRPRPPYEPEAGPRMDEKSYLAVFDELFTQYYPHDHLDRPALDSTQEPPNYRSEIATGPLATNTPQHPDLYLYLREDIQVCAGRLTQVEREWAQEQFDLAGPPRPSDPQWHIGLARFGRALHAIEDFFAHSNFVEHAITVLGDDFVPPVDYDRDTWGLRLQQWQRQPNQSLPEDNVVTGTFDKNDTFISLLHALTDFFGMRLVNPETQLEELWNTVSSAPDRRDELLFEFQNFMYEFGELAANPKDALADLDNTVAQALRKQIPSIPTVGTLSPQLVGALIKDLPRADIPLVRKLPEWAFAPLAQALVFLHTAIAGGYTAYQLIRDVLRLAFAADNTIKRECEDIVGDQVAKWVLYYGNRKLEEMIGSRRIGCHSLLAKDYEQAALYSKSFNCAAAVHWFVVSTMTRQPTSTAAAVSTKRRRHVDWLHLLEFFLSHPAYQRQPQRRDGYLCATITHVVTDRRPLDSLVSLQKMYAPTACKPSSFTWRSIADLNFKTAGLSDSQAQKVIHGALATGGGSRGGKGTMMFKPGTRLLVPNQRLPAMVPAQALSQTAWWAEVIRHDNWRILPGYTPTDAHESYAPLNPYTPRYISADQASALVAKAAKLRKRLESAYR